MFRTARTLLTARASGVAIGSGGGYTPPPPPPPPGGSTGMKVLGHGDTGYLQSLHPNRILDGVVYYVGAGSFNEALNGHAGAGNGKKYNATTLITWPWTSDYVPSDPTQYPTLHARCANGEFDSQITQQLNAIASHTPDCYLHTFNEFNGWWFSHYAGWNPQEWIRMYRHIYTLAKNVNSRFKVCWIPSWQFSPNWTDQGQGNPNAPSDLASYWPGDDVVDFAGLDWYDGQGSTPAERWNNAMTHAWGARAITDFAAAHGKRMVYPEWGLWGEDDTLWMTNSFDFFNSTNVEYFSYFNMDWDGPTHHLSHYPNSRSIYASRVAAIPNVGDVPVPPPSTNKSYLVADGHGIKVRSTNQPFLWLFDTFWNPQHRSNNDYSNYLSIRKNQGFAGFMMEATAADYSFYTDPYMYTYNGHLPYNSQSPLDWNMNFWAVVKSRIQEANDNGLVVCMTCGSPGRSGDRWKLYGVDDAYAWGYKIGSYFRNMNVVFALTMDRHADRNDHWGLAEYAAEAEGIADGWNAAVEQRTGTADWSTTFIIVHPDGDSRSSSAYWHTAEFISANGHQEWNAPQNIYTTCYNDFFKDPPKPSISLESVYESTGMTDYGYIVGREQIRQQAMHSFFAGAGHTYGFWNNWLDSTEYTMPGSYDLSRIGAWLRARPFSTFIPDQSIITSNVGTGVTRKAAVRVPDSTTWHIYFPVNSGNSALNLSKVSGGSSVKLTWWNPTNSNESDGGTLSGSQTVSCPWSDGILSLTTQSVQPPPPPPASTSYLYADGHLVRKSSDSTPLFGLFDTTWKLNRTHSDAQVQSYLDIRSNQGWTGIQCFAYATWTSYWYENERQDYNGNYPFLNDNPLQLNMPYWNRWSWIIDQANARNLYIYLNIGDALRNDVYYRIWNNNDAYTFGYNVGNVFRTKPNLIIGITNDKHPDGNYLGVDGCQAMAEGVTDAFAQSGSNFNWSADWSKSFIGTHPDGDSRSTGAYLHNAPWLKISSFQCWNAPQNIYNTSISDYWRTPYKPSWMMEGIYEDATGQNDYGRVIDQYDVREQAMHSWFAGVWHTYGCWYNWRIICDYYAAGAVSLGRIANWCRSRPWSTWTPDQSIMTSGEGSGESRKVAVRTPDSMTWHIYFPINSGSATLNLTKLGGSAAGTWWNPANEETSSAGTYSGSRSYSCPYNDGILTLTRV